MSFSKRILKTLFGIPIEDSFFDKISLNDSFSKRKNHSNISNYISISEGQFPNYIPNKIFGKPLTEFSETEFIYRAPGVANYYIKDGLEIIIESLSKNNNEVFLYFLSNALTAALYQRNLFPLHASGVVVNNEVVLFLAPSRTGKSSTAMQLEQMGYPIFTDDTVLVRLENGKCLASGSYSIMKAWKNSLEKIEGADQYNTFQFSEEVEKYGISIENEFQGKQLLVNKVVFLKEEGENIDIQPVSPLECMKRLIENTYRSQWIQPMKKGEAHFRYISSIAPLLKGYVATRPRNKDSFKEFAEAIIKEVF